MTTSLMNAPRTINKRCGRTIRQHYKRYICHTCHYITHYSHHHILNFHNYVILITYLLPPLHNLLYPSSWHRLFNLHLMCHSLWLFFLIFYFWWSLLIIPAAACILQSIEVKLLWLWVLVALFWCRFKELNSVLQSMT